jgi:TPR repeat protein
MNFATLILAATAFASALTAAETNRSAATKGASATKAAAPAATNSAADDFLARGADLEHAGQLEQALQFYRQAELAGSSEGAFRAGELSWTTAATAKGRNQLLKMDAGLRYFYRAATNQHAAACLSLSRAFREGLGVPVDLKEAYTWLLVAKNQNPALPTDALDQLVVQLDAAGLQQAQETARRWLAGGWPARVAPEIIQGDPRLKIYGVTLGANASVLINRKTFMSGDSASVTPLPEKLGGGKANPASLDVTCAAIGPDYVLVKVAGEPDVRLLALGM